MLSGDAGVGLGNFNAASCSISHNSVYSGVVGSLFTAQEFEPSSSNAFRFGGIFY